MRWDWQDQSNERWGHPAKPEGDQFYFTIAVGCLQRIATALEALVDLSDPEKIKKKEEQSRWDERWALYQSGVRRLIPVRNDALDRLAQGRRMTSALRCDIKYILGRNEPWAGTINDIDSVKLSKWVEEATAYWATVKLPERIGKDGTKKQARYVEWLGSSSP